MGKTTDIRAAVEAELKFDPRVNDADIHVANVNGDVALNGTVPNYPQYLEAAAATQRVSGVKNVFNHLEVALPASDFRDDVILTTAANNALAANVTVPDGVEATAEDGNVDLHVQEALSRSALVPDDSDVKAATDGSIITLTGHVRTWAEHDAVVGAAWMARGVVDVDDELQITG